MCALYFDSTDLNILLFLGQANFALDMRTMTTMAQQKLFILIQGYALMRRIIALAFLALAAVLLVQSVGASYRIQNINTTIALNGNNTTAQVSEIINVYVSNSSYVQYNKDRIALNLTLSDWQSIIGPSLTQYIDNPEYGLYGFKFFPGPLVRGANNYTASLLMSYYVKNVTSVKNVAPRLFLYTFNSAVLNFEHAASGEVLPNDTTFTITLPKGAVIESVYPNPDSPASLVLDNNTNVTKVSWYDGEPLDNFKLTYVTKQSLQNEVGSFFVGIYKKLGILTYIIGILVIVLFLIYTYLRASH